MKKVILFFTTFLLITISAFNQETGIYTFSFSENGVEGTVKLRYKLFYGVRANVKFYLESCKVTSVTYQGRTFNGSDLENEGIVFPSHPKYFSCDVSGVGAIKFNYDYPSSDREADFVVYNIMESSPATGYVKFSAEQEEALAACSRKSQQSCWLTWGYIKNVRLTRVSFNDYDYRSAAKKHIAREGLESEIRAELQDIKNEYSYSLNNIEALSQLIYRLKNLRKKCVGLDEVSRNDYEGSIDAQIEICQNEIDRLKAEQEIKQKREQRAIDLISEVDRNIPNMSEEDVEEAYQKLDEAESLTSDYNTKSRIRDLRARLKDRSAEIQNEQEQYNEDDYASNNNESQTNISQENMERKEQLVEEANKLIRENKLDEAIDKLKEAQEIDPTDKSIQSKIDDIQDFQNQYADNSSSNTYQDDYSTNNNGNSTSQDNAYEEYLKHQREEEERLKKEQEEAMYNLMYALSQIGESDFDQNINTFKFSFSHFNQFAYKYALNGIWGNFFWHFGIEVNISFFKGWKLYEIDESDIPDFIHQTKDIEKYVFQGEQCNDLKIYKERFTIGFGFAFETGPGLRFQLSKKYALQLFSSLRLDYDFAYRGNIGFILGPKLEIGNKIVGLTYNINYYGFYGQFGDNENTTIPADIDQATYSFSQLCGREVRTRNGKYYGWDDNNFLDLPRESFIGISFSTFF